MSICGQWLGRARVSDPVCCMWMAGCFWPVPADSSCSTELEDVNAVHAFSLKAEVLCPFECFLVTQCFHAVHDMHALHARRGRGGRSLAVSVM